MIIFAKKILVAIDTRNVLSYEYDYLNEELVAHIVKEGVGQKVLLLESGDEDYVEEILTDIITYELSGKRSYIIKEKTDEGDGHIGKPDNV